jgi:hypothetical protein
MCRKFNRLTLAALVVSLLVVGGLQAQTTTGRLIGSVTDGDGLGLPGVAIRITSDVLIGGPRATVTDAQGDFQIISLYPGEYAVQASLSGFVTQERQEVRVPLGGAASLIIVMPSGTFESEIEVFSETPVVDPTQVNTEQIFDEEYLANAAIGSSNRQYQAVLSQTAGVVGTSNPYVFGSTLGENAYFVDGMDTTDPVTSTFGINFAFDAIAEIQLQTSGFEAEYGRATGGIVNLITKSGGNQFSGTLDARYRNDSFQEGGDYYDTSELDTSYENFAATLGGPIVRDKLWFFAAYNYVDSQDTPADSPTTYGFVGNYTNLKLTWQIGSNWRLTGKYSGDPADIDNANASQYRTADATRFQTQPTDVYTADLNAVLSDSLMWNTTVGTSRGTLDSTPQSGDIEAAGTYDYVTGIYSDNYMNQQYRDSTRDEIATDLTWFVDNLAGSHEFKGGIQYSGTEFTSANCTTGTAGGACGVGSSGFSYYDNYGPYFQWEDVDSGPRTDDGTLWTAYVQDAWRVMPNLTLKLGVRMDQQKFSDRTGAEMADMTKVQPRVGVAWDITGDAKNVVRFNWGRFMHPNALTLPNFVRENDEPSYRWYSCQGILRDVFGFDINSAEDCQAVTDAIGYDYMQGYEPDRDPYGWGLSPSQVYGSAPNVIDPDLGPTYADTLSVSFEREVGNRASIEFTYVDKSTKDIFEDTCDGNLGPDGPSADHSCDSYIMANLPGLSRDYEAFIARYETRTFSWLTLLASYTYSESKGNQEYNQNAGSDFDFYPAHYENRFGFLNDHRQHRVKLNGFFLLPYDFTIGFDTFWSSIFTWEPHADPADSGGEFNGQTIPVIPYGVWYAEPRGNRDGWDAYGLDLQVSKGFTIADRVRLLLIGSVYNALSTEYETGVCESISGCGDYELGDPDDWRTPRRWEVGFRVEF